MIRFSIRLAIALAVEKWIVKPERRLVVHAYADASEAIEQLERLKAQFIDMGRRYQVRI